MGPMYVFHCQYASKNGFTVICVPCMLEHVCYEPFSLRKSRSGRYLMLIV